MIVPENQHTNRDGDRYYTWAGERFWSVTTLMRGVPNWAKKITAETAVENLDLLTQMAAKDTAAAIDWLKRTADRKRDSAADRGSQVHALIEQATLKGVPVASLSDDEAIRPWLIQADAFLDQYKPTVVMAEQQVYNRAYGYAGTLDSVMELSGASFIEVHSGDFHDRQVSAPWTAVVDFKTSDKPAVYPETAIQLAMCRHAEFVGLPNGTEQDMPATDGGVVVNLYPGGFRVELLRTDEEIMQVGLYAGEMFRWTNDLSKTVKLGAL